MPRHAIPGHVTVSHYLSSHPPILPDTLHLDLKTYPGSSKVVPQSALLPTRMALVLSMLAVDGGCGWEELLLHHLLLRLNLLLAVSSRVSDRPHPGNTQHGPAHSASTPLPTLQDHTTHLQSLSLLCQMILLFQIIN